MAAINPDNTLIDKAIIKKPAANTAAAQAEPGTLSHRQVSASRRFMGCASDRNRADTLRGQEQRRIQNEGWRHPSPQGFSKEPACLKLLSIVNIVLLTFEDTPPKRVSRKIGFEWLTCVS
jgi:hypothetical protein